MGDGNALTSRELLEHSLLIDYEGRLRSLSPEVRLRLAELTGPAMGRIMLEAANEIGRDHGQPAAEPAPARLHSLKIKES